MQSLFIQDNQELVVSYYSKNLFFLFGDAIDKIRWVNSSLEIFLKPDYFFFIVYFLKMSTLFKSSQLMEIICVDTLLAKNRFLLRYEFLCLFSFRYSLNFYVSELQNVCSISSLYSNATWMEREVWDMFGVFFMNKDLRRILTDYGFEGHPLRKDFPLSGFVELFYDECSNMLHYYPIALTQEYRDFKFSNPWRKY